MIFIPLEVSLGICLEFQSGHSFPHSKCHWLHLRVQENSGSNQGSPECMDFLVSSSSRVCLELIVTEINETFHKHGL